MAQLAQELMIEGLQRAAAEPKGMPLFARKAGTGLFLASGAGKQAAQRCLDESWLRIVPPAPRGKTKVDIAALTDAGLAYLLAQVHPRNILNSFIAAVEARRRQLNELLALVRLQQESLAELGGRVDQVLSAWKEEAVVPVPAAAPYPMSTNIMDLLKQWRQGGALGDCPLPHLYRSCGTIASIGQFHDEIRHLHEGGRLYLHPWTGPLYEIPEPALALLTGHEVAYYASPR